MMIITYEKTHYAPAKKPSAYNEKHERINFGASNVGCQMRKMLLI